MPSAPSEPDETGSTAADLPRSPAPERPLRVAVTLEQCWHEVPGGTAVAALESLRALQAHAHVDLVGVSARHGRAPSPPWQPPIEVEALPLPRVALYESWHWLRRPSVERATGRVDVIHATGMAVPPRTRPLVVTVHDLAFLHDPSTFTRRGVSFFRRAIDLARRDADLVICPSTSTLDDCVAHGFERDRLRLVPWGIEIAPAGQSAIDDVRRRYRLDRPYVFWTGTIEPRKNLPTLLAAFARLDRDDVDLVIGGPEGWNDELAALDREGRGRVRHIGFVPEADRGPLYAGAAVFCFPSWREGFGLPVLEAMAQGAPVVTSAGTATEEVVGVGDPPDGAPAGLLVDPGDRDALATALGRLLDDRRFATAVGEAGRARAATFSWARTAAALMDAYREVAA